MLGMSGPGIVGSSGLSATRTAGHELRLFGIAGSDELRAIEESSRPRNGRVESNAEIVFVNCLLAIERIAHGHTLFLGLQVSCRRCTRAIPRIYPRDEARVARPVLGVARRLMRQSAHMDRALAKRTTQ